MRTLTVLSLCCLFLAPRVCSASGDHRGRDLAIRGMRIVAARHATPVDCSHGWQLVAEGVSVLLALPGEWQVKEPDFSDHIESFLSNCGRAAHLRAAPCWDGDMHCEVTRDSWGACDAVWIAIKETGPTVTAADILVGRIGSRMIAGAWMPPLGSSHRNDDRTFLSGDLAAWPSHGTLWAVVAGSHGQCSGGNSYWPGAVLLRSRGDSWELVSKPELGGDGWVKRSSFSLRDVDGDGIPEIVANRYAWAIIGDDSPATGYVVYKFADDRYRNVWYAPVHSVAGILGRFCDVWLEGQDAHQAYDLVTDPAVMRYARKIGLSTWHFHVKEVHDNIPEPYAVVEDGAYTFRLSFARLADGSWRISDVGQP